MSILIKIRNRMHWILSYLKSLFYQITCKAPNVKGIEDTINKLKEVSGSISRYGDGELDIMVGRDIPFQKYDDRLAKKMQQILSTDHDDFLVGLPDYFDDLSAYNDKAKRYFKDYLRENRGYWYTLTKKKKVYYCANITRPYMDFNDKSKGRYYFNLLKNLWEGEKIVIVEGEKSRLGVRNDLFDGCIEIKRILCPATNAFTFYDEIKEKINEITKDYMILLALGPTATALAYDLYCQGYRAIDIGHVDIEYEWCRMGATEKVPIKDKYTNEAESKGGLEVGKILDDAYCSQIYAKIGCE